MDKFVTRKRRSGEALASDTVDIEKKRSKTESSDDIIQSRTVISNNVIKNSKTVTFSKLSSENLDCDYGLIFTRDEARKLFLECERDISYFTGQLSKVFVFGKWHDIPRKQVAFGDEGLTYKYSNNVVPARSWTPLLRKIKDAVEAASGRAFNFVLVNRYADGRDHMGEHKDDEEELVKGSPIASLSLGQSRDFVFRHQDARGGAAKKSSKAPPPSVKIKLESGSLLMMNSPTNDFWYHSLPKRSLSSAPDARINMTFRQMIHIKR